MPSASWKYYVIVGKLSSLEGYMDMEKGMNLCQSMCIFFKEYLINIK